MSTKERFLKDIKEVMDRYHVFFIYNDTNGIPNGTINNLPNKSIDCFKVEIENEDGIYTYISGNDFIDYMCNEK